MTGELSSTPFKKCIDYSVYLFEERLGSRRSSWQRRADKEETTVRGEMENWLERKTLTYLSYLLCSRAPFKSCRSTLVEKHCSKCFVLQC